MSSPVEANSGVSALVGDTAEYDALNEKRFLAGVVSFFISKSNDGDDASKTACKQIANDIKKYAALTDEHVEVLAPQVSAVEVFVSSPLSMPKEPYKALLIDVESKPEPSEQDKRQAEDLKQKGNEQLKENKAREAVQSYSEALKLDSKNPILYCNRAAAFTKADSFVEAVDDCKIATLLDPKYSKAYARMGTAYSSLKRFEEAKEAIEKAIELEPDNDTYKNNLKIVLEEIEQTEKLRTDTESGLKENFGGQMSEFGDFMHLMNNPQFMSYAQNMMKTPEFQQRMATVMNAMMSGDPSAVMSGMPPGMGGAGGGFPGMMPGMFPGMMGGGGGSGTEGGGPDFETAMMLGQQMFSRNPQMMEELQASMSSLLAQPGAGEGSSAGGSGDAADLTTSTSGPKSGGESNTGNANGGDAASQK